MSKKTKFERDYPKRNRQYVLVEHWMTPLMEKGLWKYLTRDYRTELIKEVFELKDDTVLELGLGRVEEINDLLRESGGR